MKVKTDELAEEALDWAVAKADGLPVWVEDDFFRPGRKTVVAPSDRHDPDGPRMRFRPSGAWQQGGPLRSKYRVAAIPERDGSWSAVADTRGTHANGELDSLQDWYQGPTELVATMRAIVAFVLGGEVDVPGELLAHRPTTVDLPGTTDRTQATARALRDVADWRRGPGQEVVRVWEAACKDDRWTSPACLKARWQAEAMDEFAALCADIVGDANDEGRQADETWIAAMEAAQGKADELRRRAGEEATTRGASLESLIAKAVGLKTGDKEFLLARYSEEDEWIAGVGNPSQWVALGESEPEVEAKGGSPREAVLALIEKLEAQRKDDNGRTV